MSAKVLIIDDNLKNIQIIGNVLMEEKIGFAYALSGKEGLDLVRENEYDLLLVDVMMPDIDGFEFVEIIRKYHRFDHLPIIFITAKIEEESIIRGFQLGANDYITKPFSKFQLLARIQNMLTLKSYADKLQKSAEILEEEVEKRTQELQNSLDLLYSIQKLSQITYAVLNTQTLEITFKGYSMLRAFIDMKPAISLEEILEYIHPDDRKEIQRRLIVDLIRYGKKLDQTVRFVHKDSAREFYIRLISESSKIIDGTDLYITIQDLTEDIKQRKNMERIQRMESLGQLSAGIAHDFNNLLTGIMGSAEILEMDKNISDEKKQFLDVIRDSGERAAKMVRQILDMSHATENVFESFSLKDSIQGIIPLLKRVLPANIQFEFVNKLSSGDSVYADKGKIGQAIINLVVNARDAQPEGGAITLTLENRRFNNGARCFICAKRLSGDFIALSINDNGTGIPQDVLEHIFEPFYTTKSKDKGTGLGLAQVYGIITQSKGHLQVKSTMEVGSSFTILLPHIEVEITDELVESQIIRGNNEKILLVDDSAITRNTIAHLLKALGYSVVTQGTAEEALEYYRDYQSEIHLVISDTILPGMNGAWLYKEIRKLNSKIPVIHITASPKSASQILEKTSLPYQLLKKPIYRDIWSKTIAEALGKTSVNSAPKTNGIR
jgi:two-component system, cell cycle sensor histidine kinase and response regulator CckA